LPGVVPELIYAIQKPANPPASQETTPGCVHCLMVASLTPKPGVYLISGTSYCADHALAILRSPNA
jgi:hypothetical protein